MGISLVNSLYNSLSGLQTTQTLLDTTTRNITNSQTANYVVEKQHTLVNPYTGGAQASEIQRAVDESLLTRQRLTASQTAFQQTRQNILQQISGLSGAPSDNNSLASQVSNLGNAFSALSSNPNDPGTALSVINSAQQLVQSLNDQTRQVSHFQSSAQKSLQDDIAGVNSMLHNIADLNARIRASQAQKVDPSQLQDQRDAVAHSLAQKMQINTFYDNSGALNIYTANYQPLVGKFATVISYNPATNVISTPTAALGNVGGQMGAYQAIYDTDTTQYLQQLDGFARALADSMNKLSSPISAQASIGSNVVSVRNASILRVGQTVEDSNFPNGAKIGAIIGTSVVIVGAAPPIPAGGLTTTPQAGATVAVGSNVITLAAAAPAGLTVGDTIIDPSFPPGSVIGGFNAARTQIFVVTPTTIPPAGGFTNAAAIPAISHANAVTAVNNGSINILSLPVGSTKANAIANAAQLFVSTPMPLFINSSQSPTSPTVGNPPYYSGGIQVNQALITDTNYATVLKMGSTSTTPGSVSTVGSTATTNDAIAAVGAFNALTSATPSTTNNTIDFNLGLAGGANPVIGSSTVVSFEDAATAISVTAGQNATTADNTISQLQTLGSQLDQTISSKSGVSLDNEMSNLIVLQNAYSSNAQVTSTAQKMLDTLLGIVR